MNMYVDETDSDCGYQDFLTHYLEDLLKVTEKTASCLSKKRFFNRLYVNQKK